MLTKEDKEKRQSIIDACLRMNALGINQGTSGNISLRHGEGMLVTPTSTPYEAMQPEQIVYMHLDGSHDPAQRPSSEWRFHRDILKARARRARRRPRPSALLDDAGDHGDGDSAGSLHGRLRWRRQHPLRALRDLRHPGTVRTCRSRAGRPAGLPAGTSWHDRDRAFAVKGDVARGRGRKPGAAISRLPADRHAAFAVEVRRSRRSASAWPDTATRTSESYRLAWGNACYFATKPASFISDALSLSSSSRNFSMSLPVRKIGFSACFSMYSLYSVVCVTFWNRST